MEASIKLPPTAGGLWPAFWLLGADIRTNPWPACGETDILEMGHADGMAAGTQERYFNGACHWGTDAGAGLSEKATHLCAPYSLQDGAFHLYTLIWEPEGISVWLDRDKYPDSAPYFTLDIREGQPAAPYFHHDFYILFNLAVGGYFTGILDPERITALGDRAAMYVDFVKVYQKASSAPR